MLGSQSCGTFYSEMERGSAGAQGGTAVVRMSPLEFTIDVEKAAFRALTPSEYFYFTHSFLEKNVDFDTEIRETLSSRRVRGLRRDIGLAVGVEFMRSGLFPLNKYFAPIEGFHG